MSTKDRKDRKNIFRRPGWCRTAAALVFLLFIFFLVFFILQYVNENIGSHFMIGQGWRSGRPSLATGSVDLPDDVRTSFLSQYSDRYSYGQSRPDTGHLNVRSVGTSTIQKVFVRSLPSQASSSPILVASSSAFYPTGFVQDGQQGIVPGEGSVEAAPGNSAESTGVYTAGVQTSSASDVVLLASTSASAGQSSTTSIPVFDTSVPEASSTFTILSPDPPFADCLDTSFDVDSEVSTSTTL